MALEQFLTAFLDFKYFFVLALPAVLFIGVILYGAALHTAVNKPSIRVLGLLFMAKKRDILGLSLIITRSLFIYSCVVFMVQMNLPLFVFWWATTALLYVLCFRIKFVVLDFILLCVQTGAVVLYNMLLQYMKTVRTDMEYIIIAVLLGILIVLICTLSAFKMIEAMTVDVQIKEDTMYEKSGNIN